jgi:hypothetical protein
VIKIFLNYDLSCRGSLIVPTLLQMRLCNPFVTKSAATLARAQQTKSRQTVARSRKMNPVLHYPFMADMVMITIE